MIVLGIILLLAGILIGAGSKMVTQAKIKRTRSLLATLAAIATEYEVVTGGSVAINSPVDSIEAFVDDAKVPPTTEQMLKALGSDAHTGTTVKDKWGVAVRYAPSNEHNSDESWYTTELRQHPRPFFASAGPDGEWGDEQERVNREAGQPHDANLAAQADDNMYSYEE